MRLLCIHMSLLAGLFLLGSLLGQTLGEATEGKLPAGADDTSDKTPKKRQWTADQLRSAADTALSKGDFNVALNYYGELLMKEPSQINFLKRSEIHQKKKSWRSALQDLDSAVEADPKFVKGFETRGNVRSLIGECALAKADYQMVIQLKPKTKEKIDPKITSAAECEGFLEAAYRARDRRNYHEAKDFATRALNIAHESETISLFRCEMNLALSDYQSILVDTRTILKNNQGNIEVLLVRAKALYLMGDHDVALSHLKEGLRLAPDHAALIRNTKQLKKLIKLTTDANSAMAQNRNQEAAELLGEAISVDPDNRQNNIQLLLLKCKAQTLNKDGVEAETTCSQIIQMDPDNINAYMQRAKARLVREMWQDAINDFERAVQLDQNNREAQQGLHDAKLELKKSQRKDYYKILGVPKDASQADIKRNFRKLAMQWHPDKHTGEDAKKLAETEFREVGEAYEVLSVEETRAKYDRGEDLQEQQRGPPRQHFNFNGQTFQFNF